MSAIFGAVLCVITIIAGVRVVKLAFKLVNKLFDDFEDWF